MAAVHRWVTRETDTTPARILDRHGFGASGDYVRGVVGSPDKQRGGVYATAELCITWLTNRAAVEWVTPRPGRPAFDPAEFAGSCDALYLVSREGRGTLAPLTTALTAAVCEAAEQEATTSPRGRLPVPMVVVLDEVANVCRWPDLPDLYSHYGGRGIYLLAILQSWRQGEDTWGARGMAKLWSAATVRIYGGGDTEVAFLDELRKLIGTYRPQQTSASQSRQGRTVSYSEASDDILDVADFSALPRGRQLLIASGTRPVLISCRPWFTGPHREGVESSIAAHDPATPAAGSPEPDVLPAGDALRTVAGWQ
jgi:type IV secretory pathway TraG/TraD family ATPase VirD4